MRTLTATRWTMPWPQRLTSRALTVGLRAIGVALLVSTGLIHLSLASWYYVQEPYIGILFYLSSAGALGAALLVAVGLRGAWIVGALVTIGAFTGLVLSSTVGLPGFVDSLDAPRAHQSLLVEGLFAAVYAAAVAFRRTPLGV